MPKATENYLQKVAMMEVPAVATPGAPLAGQLVLTGVVQGPVVEGNGFYLKAHPDNTDTVWVGNDGNNTVTATNGFPLNPGETIFVSVENLNRLYFRADVDSERVCWIRI